VKETHAQNDENASEPQSSDLGREDGILPISMGQMKVRFARNPRSGGTRAKTHTTLKYGPDLISGRISVLAIKEYIENQKKEDG